MNPRNAFPTLTLLLLPILVAVFDLSLLMTLLLLVVWLGLRWVFVMRRWVVPSKQPAVVLETIGASHFAEKVRWCLDRLGIDYSERVCAGTLGAFYAGRTVPVLEFRTGAVTSRIGNSPEILRYLWGAYGTLDSAKAAFLEPTPERVEFEQRLDRYGQNLQVWVYFYLLDHRDLQLDVWGANDPRVPAWQRLAIRLVFPIQVVLLRRAFRLTPKNFEKTRGHIEALLADVDARLADSPNSILGDEVVNYTDLAFAALSSIWVVPENLAGGSRAVIDLDAVPAAMLEDVERLRGAYPRALEFIERLYRDERTAAGDNV